MKTPVLVLCSLTLLWISAGLCKEEDGQLALGRSIFQEGVGRDGRKLKSSHQNRYGAGIPVVCADCHGKDGGGGGESFIVAPSVRWSDLSKRYRASRAGGEQTPYDRSAFARALRSGVDASGDKLDPMMPSLTLADDEVDALISYLNDLSTGDKGRTVQQKAAALLPAPGVSVFGDIFRKSLSSCSNAGEAGERHAALEIIEYTRLEEVPALLDAALESGQKLTLVAPFIVGWEAEYQRMVSTRPISTVFPITHQRPSANARWYFQLPTSFDLIARLLTSARDRGFRKLIIHYDEGDRLSSDLLDFSLGVAKQLGIEVVSAPDFTGLASSHHTMRARLWLHGVDPVKALSAYEKSLHLAPAMFLKRSVPVGVASKGEQSPASRFTVAYPYAPLASGQWRPPATVWAAVSCEFLAKLDLREPLAEQAAAIRLNTAEYPALNGRPRALERVSRVYLSAGKR